MTNGDPDDIDGSSDYAPVETAAEADAQLSVFCGELLSCMSYDLSLDRFIVPTFGSYVCC